MAHAEPSINMLHRRDIYGADADPPLLPSEETVAVTVGLPVERVCCVRIVPTAAVQEAVPEEEVAYTWTEVYYEPCEGCEEVCENGE